MCFYRIIIFKEQLEGIYFNFACNEFNSTLMFFCFNVTTTDGRENLYETTSEL